jgi:hypothetical protein
MGGEDEERGKLRRRRRRRKRRRVPDADLPQVLLIAI